MRFFCVLAAVRSTCITTREYPCVRMTCVSAETYRIVLDERKKERRDALAAARHRIVCKLECGRNETVLVRLKVLHKSRYVRRQPSSLS